MKLEIEQACVSERQDLDRLLARAADAAQAAEGVTEPLYVYVRLTDDEEICRINSEQRGINRATDVLSFPQLNYPERSTAAKVPDLLRQEYDPDVDACCMGEIIISVDHARQQALEYGHSFERELSYLFIHGMFHLFGYDHIKDDDRAIMRKMEEKALAKIDMQWYDRELLLKEAEKAMEHSYSPYSHFRVGACLLAKSGKMYTGCNIENAAYSVTNCAERTALFKAVSEGEREFVAIAVTADKSMAWPCGVCRQALYEFSPDMTVIVGYKGEICSASLRELLYAGFGANPELLGKDQ